MAYTDPKAKLNELAREYDERQRRMRELAREYDERRKIEAELEAAPPPPPVTKRGLVADAVLGIGRGAAGALESTYGLIATLDEARIKYVGKVDLNPFNDTGKGLWISPSEVAELGEQESVVRQSEEGFAILRNELLPQTERVTGAVAEPISQFVVGFLLTRGVGKAAKAAELGTKGTIAVGAARGGVADFVAFDGHEERLSNVVQKYPALQNPISEFLAADADDSEIVGRLKNTLEGLGLGAVAESLVIGLRAVKASRQARRLAKLEEDAKFDRPLPAGIEVVDDVEEVVLETVDDAAPVRSVRRSTEPLTLRDDNGMLEVAAGQDGRAVARANSEGIQIIDSKVADEYRGTGLGLDLYVRYAEEAIKRGVKMVSDTQVSADARRVWESLESRGFKLRRNFTDADINADGTIVSGTRPAYEVIQFPRELTETAAEGFVSGIRRSVERLRSDPEKVFGLYERISEGDVSGAVDMIDFNASKVDFGQLADDLVDDPDAIRKLINTVSEELAPIIDDGVKSWGDTEKAAMGIKARTAQMAGGELGQVDDFFADVTSDGGLAARYLAAEKFMYGLAAAVQRSAKLGATDAAAEVQTLKLLQLYATTQAMVRSSKKEIARGLQIMRKGRELEKLTGETLQRTLDDATNPAIRRALMDKLANARSVGELNSVIARSQYETWRDVALSVYIQGLLSGISTLTLNVGGNALKVIDEIIARSLAGAVGSTKNAVRRALGKEELDDIETFSTVAAYINGTMEGLRISLQAPVAEMAQAAAKGDFKGVRAAAQKASAEGKMGTAYTAFRTMESSVGATQEAVEAAGRGVDSVVRDVLTVGQLPLRSIVGTDDFFKVVAKQQAIAGAAMRQALAEARAAGHGKAWVDARAAELTKTPTADMLAEALEHANYQTFQSALQSKFAKGFESMLRNVPELRLIVPFYRTPANLIKQGLERTPIGILTGLNKGGIEGSRQVARGITGTAILAWAYSGLAEEGKLVGSRRPSNKASFSSSLDGVAPYSMEINGKWYQFNRLDPMGFTISLVADLKELIDYWQATPEEESLFDEIMGLAASVTRQFSEKTWTQGVTDFVTAVSSGDAKQFGKYVSGKANDLLTPYQSFARRLSQADEEFMRDAVSFADRLKQKYGLLGDEKLAIRRDYLGRPVKQMGSVVSPVVVSERADDPVTRELVRLNFPFDMPPRSIDGIPLDPHLYNRYLELRGQQKYNGVSLQDQLAKLVGSENYAQLTRTEQIDQIKSLVSAFGAEAKKKLLTENDALLKEWRYQKLWVVYRERPESAWPKEMAELRAAHLKSYSLKEKVRDALNLPPAGTTIVLSPVPDEYMAFMLAKKEIEKVSEDPFAQAALRRRISPEDWALAVENDPSRPASTVHPSLLVQ